MTDFKVVRYKVKPDLEGKGPVQPFSAVFLSDLHNASYGKGNERLLQEIRNENPAAVFVAGDMITAGDTAQFDAALSLMDELTKQYPVYYANGNHESRLKRKAERFPGVYERYADTVRSCGVHLLENSHEKIEIHRLPITVWGLELPGECFYRTKPQIPDRAMIGGLLGEVQADSFPILLAHHPMYFEAYASWGAGLVLSGHLHGGIVRLPFLGGVVSPQMRLFPKYDRGLYTLRRSKMIVSAGLGSHTIPLRINNPPELVVIDFV